MSVERAPPILAFFVLGLVMLLVGPWWLLLVVAFAYGCSRARVSPGFAFWPGLLVGALLYLLGALWYGGGDGGLAAMLGRLFGVGSAAGLYAVTVLLGGLSAGLFAMLGAYTRAVILPVARPAANA